MVLERKHNRNQVVMEAVVDAKHNITDIQMYWNDVDPAYQAKARKKGIMTDRAEFTKMDYFAYGIKTRIVQPSIWEFSFTRLSNWIFTVVSSDKGTVAIMPGHIEVQKVFIEDYKVLGIPKVKHIIVTGRTEDRDNIITTIPV